MPLLCIVGAVVTIADDGDLSFELSELALALGLAGVFFVLPVAFVYALLVKPARRELPLFDFDGDEPRS